MKDKEHKLNAKQIKFCELFVSEDFFGNGVQAYMNAYNYDKTNPNIYNSARANAAKLLTNANILKYINALLDAAGLNDQHADKQLLLVMTQNADFRAKIVALKEYNKLKGRVTTKIKHEGLENGGQLVIQQNGQEISLKVKTIEKPKDGV